jgi:hypothetical protein
MEARTIATIGVIRNIGRRAQMKLPIAKPEVFGIVETGGENL